MNTFYTSERHVLLLIALLKAKGIHKVIASPGTTNITFVASLQQDPFFDIYSAADERSAAYMACGLAAESGEPVVLSCTGATASRNYLPGLTEAYYKKLPILAVTSVQSMANVGHIIPQVIDRSVVAKDVARLSVCLPVVKDENDAWACELKVNQALLALKRHGGGPVHINLETFYSRDFSVKQLPEVRVIDRITFHDEFPVLPDGHVAVFVGSHKVWTKDETEALDKFCASHNAVVFCDHTSGYKGKYRFLSALVKAQTYNQPILPEIETLIHIGDVSGDYYTLGISAKQVWRVSEDGELRDTFRKLRYVFEMPESAFFAHYTDSEVGDDSYLALCKKAYEDVYSHIPELPFSNIWMARQLAPCLPENSVLHLGILNTLRSWNFFEIPASVLSYSNVGGFGIDGDMSSLIGASLANPEKLYFGVLGDLAFFYDMNVMGNHHVGRNVRIMLVNNGRGTEFRNYNHMANMFGADADAYMAAAGHYGNKSKDLVKHYAEDLGFEYMSASSKDEFNLVYQRFVTADMTNKPMLFEVFTDSKDESDALLVISTCLKTDKDVKHEKMVETAKKVLGEGYKTVSDIYHKLKS
ncbi:2-succinyl-5-enolpyruvyl-6-hydroxy-3-cyclohexene-1-carboxylate synthase [Phocaeicola coprophilus]|nr:2-succinyl-5-enolpyruvyl-6-hydroxy-3-cyclohexene-1-carboxylate synthase [Phocaeicola coprophilus]